MVCVLGTLSSLVRACYQRSLVSCLDAFHQIIRDEGISALWNGTFLSLLLVFNPAIQFMFYEGLKRQLLKKRMKVIPDFESST